MAWTPGLKRWSVASTWGVAGDLLRFPLPLFRGERVRARADAGTDLEFVTALTRTLSP
jgi:hypothetical protein